MLSFAVIGGVVLLMSTQAASLTASLDPENGILAGKVQAISDQNAHGQAVRFGATSSNPSVKIMPLGDSITHGYGSFSYRYPLWLKLKQAGYTNIDMVGSQTSDFVTGDIWDQDHEGHDGIRAYDVTGQIGGWANSARPDIVLIHLGTNGGTANDIGNIIDIMRGINPNIKIVLAKVIPRSLPAYDDYSTLNAAIGVLGEQKNTAQSPIIVVDMLPGFNVATDLHDGLHPNASGNQKMADTWYPAILKFLQ